MTQQPPGNYPPPPPPPGGYYPPQGMAPGPQPNTYLAFAILTTLFCCLPLGVVSIVKASQVSGLWAQGRYAEAQQSSAAAKKWAMWSLIVGIVALVVYGVLYAAGAMNVDVNTSTS